MKNDSQKFKAKDSRSKEKEAEKLFKEIGLEKDEDRNRFKGYGFDQDATTSYEIRFTNNTELKNG